MAKLQAVPPEMLSKEANDALLRVCVGIRAAIARFPAEVVAFEAELAAIGARREREEAGGGRRG